jgi:hypothetical protein
VLRLLFTEPGKELYTRELARRSFLALRTVQDELAKLEAANLIVSRSNGYQRGSGTEPSSSTVSWKARMLNLAPSVFSALCGE